MATVNLGRIKPVFRGAYSGSTAYVIDDIVTSGGSSYICIQAHGAGTQAVTQTAYWSVLASTGTDVGTTLTTQGDILFRDGSGLQRLAKGTAAQTLKMNSGATAPEWTTVAAGGSTPAYWLEVTSNSGSLNGATWYTIGGANIPVTERFDTASAVSSGIFTVPSGGAGTYKFGIHHSSSGSSSHGSSDGAFGRIQKSTDSGSSWATIGNQEVKSLYNNGPGEEITNASSEHYADSLSVGDQIRLQAFIYKGGSTNIVFLAGGTTGGASGGSLGSYAYGFKLF